MDTTMTRCCICAAPAFARIILLLRIQPVWSLVADDQGDTDLDLGLCSEHTASLNDGNDHFGDASVVFVPVSVQATPR